jgi:hypothetical protein
MTDLSPEEQYADRLKELRAAVDDRAAQNEALHEKTPAAIQHNLQIEERRLHGALVDARGQGDDAEKAAQGRLDALSKTLEKQLAFEEDRYAAETRAVAVERAKIDEMEARHAAERVQRVAELAAAKEAVDQRWIAEDKAVPPPVRDATDQQISKALDAAPNIVKTGEMWVQAAITAKTGLDTTGLELPSDVVQQGVDLAKATHERHLAVIESATPPPPTGENLANQAAHRNDVEREATNEARQALAEIHERQLEDLERALARNEISR